MLNHEAIIAKRIYANACNKWYCPVCRFAKWFLKREIRAENKA